MLYTINQTKMLKEAKESLALEKKPKSMPMMLLTFMLVIMICSAVQSLISGIMTTAAIMSDPEYYELLQSSVESGEIDEVAVKEYIEKFTSSLPQSFYMVMLASSGVMIIAALIYSKSFEKRRAATLGFRKDGAFGEYLLGLVVGAAMISVPALLCMLTGCVTFTYSVPDVQSVLLFFAAFVLQGMGEEALFRGYLMTSLSRKHNAWVAIIISALAFACMHGGNAGFNSIAFINITLFGIFAGVFMLKRGSIWAVGAIHTAWNFMQGNIFGFRVSGNPQFDSVFSASSAGFGKILSGGDFGLEGGLGVTIVLLVAILGALLMPTKKSELCEDSNTGSSEYREPINF